MPPLLDRERRRLAYSLVPLLAGAVRLLILGLGATLRVRVEGGGPVEELLAARRRFVFAFFHGRQFLLVHRHRGWKVAIMSSISYLGEIQARILQGLGFSIVRGSSSREGARVLAAMVRKVKEGHAAAFAVDGPRGPLHQVKPGAVFLAKRLGLPLIPLTFSARPGFLHRKAWDHYLLPWPFARALLLYGDPLPLDGDLSEEALARDAHRLGKALEELEERADRALGRAA